MSLPPLAAPAAADPVADLEAHLARIEAWLIKLPTPPTRELLDAINGNLTNLAKLNEIVPFQEWPGPLTHRYDLAKMKLLWAREKIDLAVALPMHIQSAREKFSQITAWLGNPTNDNHPKEGIKRVLYNATNLIGDIWQLINIYGETEELKQLLADIEASETELRRRSNAAQGPSPHLELEEAAA